jgi:hypothetical protein
LHRRQRVRDKLTVNMSLWYLIINLMKFWKNIQQ